jgi:predicted O-methyltransferase YrrM
VKQREVKVSMRKRINQRMASSKLLSRRAVAQLARNESASTSSSSSSISSPMSGSASMLSHSSSADAYMDAINSYCEKHTSKESSTLAQLRAETMASYPPNVSRMISGPLQGILLKTLAIISRAENILELGTFTGYATIAMTEAISGQSKGKVFTCDTDNQSSAIALKYFQSSDQLREHIDHRPKTASEMIQCMRDEEQRFDMVFVDADKKRYRSYILALAGYAEATTAEPVEKRFPCLLNPNAIVVVDNTLWKGLVLTHVSILYLSYMYASKLMEFPTSRTRA